MSMHMKIRIRSHDRQPVEACFRISTLSTLFASGSMRVSTIYSKDPGGALMPAVNLQLSPGPSFHDWCKSEASEATAAAAVLSGPSLLPPPSVNVRGAPSLDSGLALITTSARVGGGGSLSLAQGVLPALLAASGGGVGGSDHQASLLRSLHILSNVPLVVTLLDPSGSVVFQNELSSGWVIVGRI